MDKDNQARDDILDQNQKTPSTNNFECVICLNTFTNDQRVNLACDHSFDSKCIINYIEIKLNEGHLSDSYISCPQCNQPISENKIKSLVNSETYQKYCRLYVQNSSISNNNESNPNPMKLCPSCNKKEHEFLTCEQNENYLEADAQMERAILEFGLKKCPYCDSICEKISGCKFMKCYSPKCKGKNNFCYLCKKGITDAQHYSHYKAQGPFGNVCNTMDGNQDT